MNEFREKLAEYRKRAGLTQYGLAKASKVSQSYLNQVENGDRGIPKPATLKKLAGPLGVTYETLMEAAGYSDPVPTVEEVMDSPPQEVRDLLREEAKNDWPYLQVISEARRKGWSAHDLQKLLEALRDFRQS